jgi:hypothetical protein
MIDLEFINIINTEVLIKNIDLVGSFINLNFSIFNYIEFKFFNINFLTGEEINKLITIGVAY